MRGNVFIVNEHCDLLLTDVSKRVKVGNTLAMLVMRIHGEKSKTMFTHSSWKRVRAFLLENAMLLSHEIVVRIQFPG